MTDPLSRRSLIRTMAIGAAAFALPAPLLALDGRGSERAPGARGDTDRLRLAAWAGSLRVEERTRADASPGRAAARVGELAVGSPYQAFALEAYLRAGGDPMGLEPLTLSLTQFDCVSLVESCLAVARAAAAPGAPTWERFGREVERMRYRDGERRGYPSRLHYFSEWITDGERRGLVRDLGAALGGAEDARPLRFMTEHRASYPALTSSAAFRAIADMERALDGRARLVIPTARIPEVEGLIETGDVLAFATAIPGLDVTHSAFAYRDAWDVLRVLHAPLSGGAVEVTRATLPEYVRAIRRATGILVARPLWA